MNFINKIKTNTQYQIYGRKQKQKFEALFLIKASYF